MKTDAQVRQMWEEGQHEELADCLKGIAISTAERLYLESMQNTDADLDEVISWALEFMWAAIKSWDPSLGSTLRGWVSYRVECDIKNTQRDTMRQKRDGSYERVSLESVHSGVAYEIEDGLIDAIDVKTAIGKLPERQRLILLGLAEGATLRGLGREFGISYEMVRQDARKARAAVKEYLA